MKRSRPSYSERCVKKAISILRELAEEYSLGHVYKTIVAFWEVIELLLRAIIYERRRTTYEKPRKLINEYIKLANAPEGVPASINFLYELRRKAVHKPILLDKRSVEVAKKKFCRVMKFLILGIQEDSGLGEHLGSVC